jgi:hypothetical protein
MSNIIVTEPTDWNRENSRIQLVCHYINGTSIIIVYTYSYPSIYPGNFVKFNDNLHNAIFFFFQYHKFVCYAIQYRRKS